MTMAAEPLAPGGASDPPSELLKVILPLRSSAQKVSGIA